MLSFMIVMILMVVVSKSRRCPDNCLSCNSTDCFLCKNGYFGKVCDERCNNCLPGTPCDSKSGYCMEHCKDGLSGDLCNIKCNDSCETCSRQLNSDCKSCINGRYGIKCNEICTSECLNNQCHQTDGKCTHGCSTGYWGKNCIQKCSPFCKIPACNNETGECLNGCLLNDTGSNCSTHPAQAYDASKFLVEAIDVGLSVGITIVAMIIFLLLFICIRRTKLSRCTEETDQYAVIQISNLSSSTYPGCGSPSVTSVRLLPHSTASRNKDRIHRTLQVDIHSGGQTTTMSIEMLEINPEDAHVIHQLSDKDVHAMYFNEEEPYYNTAALIKRKIPIDNLADYVQKKTPDDFVDEFKELPRGLIKPYTESQKEENIKKNRYRGFYPYDQTRVVIKEGDSDFINASFIDGYRMLRAYIASLGPTKEFMGDLSVFWRMIWQENCGKIVMLTNLQESLVCKCDKYWPDKGLSDLYSELIVSCYKEWKRKHYIVRFFSIQENMEKRDIVQFHFTAWPDKGIPSDVQSLITFRQEVNDFNTDLNGPLLVHCSAGVGRTGTYIALDMLTREGEAEGGIDIFACVRNLREQRVKMVQTAEQYEFLHRALVYSLNRQPVYASCVKEHKQPTCAGSEEENNILLPVIDV